MMSLVCYLNVNPNIIYMISVSYLHPGLSFSCITVFAN